MGPSMKTEFSGGSWTLRPGWLPNFSLHASARRDGLLRKLVIVEPRLLQDLKVDMRPKTYKPSLARDMAPQCDVHHEGDQHALYGRAIGGRNHFESLGTYQQC